MKFFYDFEFQENGELIIPISLGVVRENLSEIYFVNTDFVRRAKMPDMGYATPWIKENVLPHLYSVTPDVKAIHECYPQKWGALLYDWLLKEEPLVEKGQSWEFVGYYADYDHVALAQLWGAMIELPIGMPMWTRDIKQWASDLGNPQLPKQKDNKHNALADARWNRESYKWLVENFDHPAWRNK